jgi:hypothetical protein
LGQLPFSITVISVAALVLLFLFIQIEKKPPFPLIDFKLLKKDNTFCKYNYYDYRANYTDGCVSKSSYFDTKPTTGRIWRKCIKYSKCSTALYDSIIDFSVASGFLVSKFGNLRPTTIRTIVTTIGFFVLFMFHSTEASIAAVLVLVAVGLALMQIGSVNVVLTSTPKQFSGISLGLNLLIFLIESSVGPVIAGRYLQANQVFVESDTDGISASYPLPVSYNLIFLTAALNSVSSIAFAK